jgi:hypothetical protein
VKDLFKRALANTKVEMEEWKLIPGYLFYQVSNLGNIRRIGSTHKNSAGFIPKFTPGSDGRLRVTLYENGLQDKWCVHQLVMLAFKGATPQGMEIRHLDGDYQHNWLTNLEFGTHKQNGQDMSSHGALPRGSTHHQTKLVDEQVIEIRRKAANGIPVNRIAKEYNLGTTTAHNIVKGVTWRHLL